ncbi:PREDICTED: uncharacterized protein LOC109193181 [Ipomoea nil]|uniref:uncharacterized protein LOC109193181 n=1 Tax=Ipomoea nil TaxID=35883 RepID=UPI00090089FA|nr:PREDICTED: uncharacterized protein LOC109193181 [Ipomoea nil]
MEEIASLWNYEELQAIDELKQRLLCTNLELEQLKVETCEETRKSNEYVKQLIHLVKIAFRERDEARDQLQKLMMNNVNYPIITANSCITESNSFSETFNNNNNNNNHHSHGSSPAAAESTFLKVGSSPELSNLDYNAAMAAAAADVKIESLVKGKPLPEKGKFLQAVLEAPPLLQTLVVAAPLPRWRNPPQLKSFHIPPVSIRGGESEISHPHPYFEMSTNTMLNNVGNFPSATLLGSQMMISAGNYGHPGKRQRFM